VHYAPAARAAARAGAGEGGADPRPTDAERAEFRGLARAWLTADLAASRRRLAADPQAGPDVAKALKSWHQDPDLAGIRDPQALAKLPEAAQKNWRTFWAEVDALIQKAEAKK
jgi:hypothetical protein